jgi:hypothetical protein
VRLHSEELDYLYYSPNIIRMIKIKENEMGKKSGTYGGEGRCIQDFGGET